MRLRRLSFFGQTNLGTVIGAERPPGTRRFALPGSLTSVELIFGVGAAPCGRPRRTTWNVPAPNQLRQPGRRPVILSRGIVSLSRSTVIVSEAKDLRRWCADRRRQLHPNRRYPQN